MRDMRWVDTERCASRAPCPGVCFTSSLRCYRPIMRGDSFVLKIRTVSLLLTPLVLCSPVGGARGSTGPRSDKPDAAQQEEYRLLSVRGTVWRGFPSGRVERLRLSGAAGKGWAGAIDKGTTAPVPSPDQRYLPHPRALAVCLYHLAAD